MTRIVAGSLGGRRLETPSGAGTRPTSDRVREALFSRVESLLGGLEGCRVLDLYAGSGAVGLEAVSRGAREAVLVESDRAAAAVARRNIATLGLEEQVRVMAARVERLLAGAPRTTADLVVADPPYSLGSDLLCETLEVGIRSGWCATDAVLVVERATRAGPWRQPADVEDLGERRYGETTLWYGRRA